MGPGAAYKVLVRPIMYSTAIAMVASFFVFLVGSWLGASMLVDVQGEVQELNPWSVAFTAGFVMLIGGMVAIGLLAFIPRSGLVFGVVSMAIFAIFLIGPLTLTEDIATAVTLICVHLAVLGPALILIVPTMLAPPDLDNLPI